MTNLEKYNQVFMEHFEISAEELPGLKYRSYVKWDSMAHMELCSILEETFDIALETIDILAFSTYEKGMGNYEKIRRSNVAYGREAIS